MLASGVTGVIALHVLESSGGSGGCHAKSQHSITLRPVGSPVPGVSPAFTPSCPTPASPVNTNGTLTVDYG